MRRRRRRQETLHRNSAFVADEDREIPFDFVILDTAKGSTQPVPKELEKRIRVLSVDVYLCKDIELLFFLSRREGERYLSSKSLDLIVTFRLLPAKLVARKSKYFNRLSHFREFLFQLDQILVIRLRQTSFGRDIHDDTHRAYVSVELLLLTIRPEDREIENALKILMFLLLRFGANFIRVLLRPFRFVGWLRCNRHL